VRPELDHARMLSRGAERDREELWSSVSAEGMVVTAHYVATDAGVRALERGGNAFDAAVAAALALGACESAGSGLGGMALALAYDAGSGRTFTIEGPCRAPALATPERIARAGSRYRGHAAVAVPGNVAVLEHLLRGYGRLAPAEVCAPAIQIAEEGFPLTELQRRLQLDFVRLLRASPAGAVFLDPAGEPRSAGAILRQPALARTLRRLVEAGFEDFYRGGIARTIGADMEANGGFLRAADLEGYPAPREAEPLACRFGGDDVRTLGPPGGGMPLVQILNLVTALGGELDLDSAAGAVRLAALIRRVREDRRRYRLATRADGVGEAERFLTLAHAHRAAARIRAEIPLDPGGAGGETTHLSIVDRQGNAVALTQSIERSFGSGVLSPSLGFLYNGYLRAFKVRSRRHPHYLVPGAPARSNAAPTIVLRGGRPRVVVGSTGSERLVSGIAQVLLRLRRETPFEASHAPRMHCTPEGTVMIEADRAPPAVLEGLARAGFALERLEPYAFKMGGLNLAVRSGERWVGVTEPRRDGAALGPRV